MAITLWFKAANVFNALGMQFWLIGQQKQVHHYTRRIEHERLGNSVLDQPAEQVTGQRFTVNVGHVGTQDQRWLSFAVYVLQERCQAWTKLDSIGIGLDDCRGDAAHVLNVNQEGSLVEETVVDSDIEAAAVFSKQPVQAGCSIHWCTPVIIAGGVTSFFFVVHYAILCTDLNQVGSDTL